MEDRQPVDESNSIKFKGTLVGEHTTYLINSNGTSKYLRCDFAEWKLKLNSPRGPFIVVVVISEFFAKFFHCHKTVQHSTGKIQLNAKLTF